MSCPSVVRLSSVTLLYPRQKLEHFGNIFASPNSAGTRTACVKILGKKSKKFYRESCKLNTKGKMEKMAFLSTNRFISKTVQDTAIVTMEDSYAIYPMTPFSITFIET